LTSSGPAAEMDDNIAVPTLSTVSEKKAFGDSRSGYTCVNPTEMDDNIMLPSSSSACQNKGDAMHVFLPMKSWQHCVT